MFTFSYIFVASPSWSWVRIPSSTFFFLIFFFFFWCLILLYLWLFDKDLVFILCYSDFLGHQIANAFEMHTPSKTVMFLALTVEDKEVVFKELTEVISQAGGVTS